MAVNYYERHLGDYARDTAHLSLLEHGVYSVLLDRYYATEAPIPLDQAYRLARARTNEEQEAVDAVLTEFFVSTPDGWRHARCDEEIERFRGKQAKAKASAKARWAGASESESERNANAMRTHSERNADAMLSSHQTPVTNQEQEQEQAASPSAPPAPDPAPSPPKADKRGSRLPDDWTLPDDWAAWAEAERPDLNIRTEGARFADYWHAKAGKDATKRDWAATWRNWVRNAKPIARAGPVSAPGKTMGAILALEAMKREMASSGNDDGHSTPALPRA